MTQPPKPTTHADLLALIESRAGALRRAGVRSVTLDGLAFTLDPPDPVIDPLPAPTKAERERQRAEQVPDDPFDDPMTYPGGVVPQRPRRGR